MHPARRLLLILSVVTLRWATPVDASINCTLIASCPDEVYEGGGVIVHVAAYADTSIVLSLGLLSMKKDGIPCTPERLPKVLGLNGEQVPNADELIFYWETAIGDSGSWEVCFEAWNDLGQADTCCQVLEIQVPREDHIAWRPAHIRFRQGAGAVEHTLYFTTKHGADSTHGIEMWARLSLSGAALALPLLRTDVGLAREYASPVFESISMYDYANDALSPESLRIGMIDFGGPALPAGIYLNSVTVAFQQVEGMARMDSLVTIVPESITQYYVNLGYDTADGNAEGVVRPSISSGCYAVTIAPPCPVDITGDVHSDSALTSSDIIRLVGRLFRGDDTFAECGDAPGDVNCSGTLTAADAIYLVNHVFKSGSLPCDICPLIWDGIWQCP